MHHKHTSDMDSDQVFVPSARCDEPGQSFLHGSWWRNVLGIVIMLVGGWPAYILANVSSQKHDTRTNHFEPSSPIFQQWDKEQDNASKHMPWYRTTKYYILLSDLGCVATLLTLAGCWARFGLLAVLQYYVGCLLIVNAWLVTITFLQHTDVRVPHFRGEEWSFLKGALSTVDRDYGLLNVVFHHITDTHVAHHLFSTMPHYHAQEATESLKKVIGEYYHWDDQPLWKALNASWSECQHVDEQGKVVFFQPGEHNAKSAKYD
jgi:omega-6 fatty acid desaturase (delta-12 desaturase)